MCKQNYLLHKDGIKLDFPIQIIQKSVEMKLLPTLGSWGLFARVKAIELAFKLKTPSLLSYLS